MNFIENLEKKVFCRVGVSKIHGVGVLAIRDIPKGINPMESKGDRFSIVRGKEMRTAFLKMPEEIKQLVIDMCPERVADDEWDIPLFGLNSISVAWYLNHSDRPNMVEHHGDFISKRKIRKGEELTVNYGTYGALNL
jgi:SET domain